MMKSVIQTNAIKEAKAMWAAYGDYVKDNGHIFKEKKKESKIGHGIEPARVLQSDGKEESFESLSKSQKLIRTLQQYWYNQQPLIENAKQFVKENKTDFLLFVIVLLLLVILLKISNI